MKKVCVVLSYYNGFRYLKEQVESIFNQNSNELLIDLYIRDDGSNCTASKDELKKILNNYDNIPCVTVGDNIGVVGSFYWLLKKAEGYDYIAFCDQDDYWLSDKLKVAVSSISHCDGPALYCSSTTLVDKDLNLICDDKEISRPSFDNALFKNFCTGCTCVINNKLRDELINRYYNENVPMHDWWFLLVAYMEGEVVFDSESYILYRQHDDNVVGGLDSIWKKAKRFILNFSNKDETRSSMMKDLIQMSNNSNPKAHFLLKMLQSKKSLLKRIKLSLSYNVVLPRHLDRISVRILILFGRY